MKIAKILIVTALSLPFFGFAQNIEVPKAVLQAFDSEYKNVIENNELAWAMIWEKKENSFVAKFVSEDKKSEITYNFEGQKLESLIEISKERLKHHHYDFVTENYPKATILHVYLQNSAVAPERMVLDIIENGKTIRLFFRPDGTFFEEKRF